MKAVGVDGCRGGWVAIVWDEGAGTVTPEIHSTLAHLIKAHADAGAIAVDIPIGLSSNGMRHCDYEARKLLGVSRASSVFPPPVYDVLDADTHAEAVLLSRSLIGKGISQQSFAIFDKIKEANDAVTPDMQDRVFEMHPEVSFHILAGRPLFHRKSTPEGYQERRVLLERAMGIQLPDRKEAFRWARPAKPDDLLDATVAAWAARAVIDGNAERLPRVAEYADSGLRMEMVFGPKPSMENGDEKAIGDRLSDFLDRSSEVSVPGIAGEASDLAPVTSRVSAAKLGTCMCDCGKSTARRFYPGHDGKLYSQLEKAEKDGDQEAANLLHYLKGNHDRSTFAEQRARVRNWLGQQISPSR